jgi:hypothetical protein
MNAIWSLIKIPELIAYHDTPDALKSLPRPSLAENIRQVWKLKDDGSSQGNFFVPLLDGCCVYCDVHLLPALVTENWQTVSTSVE